MTASSRRDRGDRRGPAHPADAQTAVGTPDTGAAAVFSCLADPTRRDLLDALAEAGEVSATELSRRLPISRQGVLKHLRVLEAAGLVSSARVGREVRYAVEPAPLREAAGWLERASTRWDRRLRALKEAAEAASDTARPPHSSSSTTLR